MNISLLGLDIAKNVFQIHGVDSAGKMVLKKRVYREKLAELMANLPTCTIAMESCRGANTTSSSSLIPKNCDYEYKKNKPLEYKKSRDDCKKTPEGSLCY